MLILTEQEGTRDGSKEYRKHFLTDVGTNVESNLIVTFLYGVFSEDEFQFINK
jgi:hypothetical protein